MTIKQVFFILLGLNCLYLRMSGPRRHHRQNCSDLIAGHCTWPPSYPELWLYALTKMNLFLSLLEVNQKYFFLYKDFFDIYPDNLRGLFLSTNYFRYIFKTLSNNTNIFFLVQMNLSRLKKNQMFFNHKFQVNFPVAAPFVLLRL